MLWFKKKSKENVVKSENTNNLVIGNKYKMKNLDGNPFFTDMYVRVEQIIGDFVQYRFIGPSEKGHYFEGTCSSTSIKTFCSVYHV